MLGDKYGNLVHLYERDCSVQRRHQKVIEFTPALCLSDAQREAICNDAIKLAKAVDYRSAGTCEFLLDKSGQHYFIEMNTRVQVEHTVSELVTGIDIVQDMILIAEGVMPWIRENQHQVPEDVTMNGLCHSVPYHH